MTFMKLITYDGAHENIKQTGEQQVQSCCCWQTIQRYMRWNAESHENSSQSFIQSNPQGDG